MADIDRMLDDALAGFDDEEDKGVSGPATSSPSVPAASSSHSPPSMRQQQGSAPSAAVGAAPSSSLGGKDSSNSSEAAGAATPAVAQPPKQESLKFDPLKRKKGSNQGSTSSANRPALTPQVFQLQEDLAQLLSEWSQAPGADDLGLPGQPLSAAASTRQQQQQQQRPPSVLDALQGLTQRTVEQQAAALPPRPAPAAAAGGAGGGVEDQQQMNLIVDTVMQHLLSKDVLYQPMKEIRDKYPPWLERQEAAAASSSSSSLQPGDLDRYRQQYACIIRLCAAYETEPGNTAKIMTLLQEMQACGEPPEDIVADMTNSIAADLGGGGAAGFGGSPLGDINFDDLDLGGLADVPDLKNCPVQ